MAARGRPKKQVDDFEIKLHPPLAVTGYLKALIATGLYGKDRTNVAMTLFNDHLKLLLSQGVIKPSDAGDVE
jgi:hypothetical protein